MTSNTGYFVECDLYYPEEIQTQTKDFPLCPENVEITYNMLSPFQKMSLEQIYGRTDYKKIDCNLFTQEEDVCIFYLIAN